MTYPIISVAKFASHFAIGLSTVLLAASLDHHGSLGSLARAGQSIADTLGVARATTSPIAVVGLALSPLAAAALDTYNRINTSIGRRIAEIFGSTLATQYLHAIIAAAGSCSITVTAMNILVDNFGQQVAWARPHLIFTTIVCTCAFKELRELASFRRE